MTDSRFTKNFEDMSQEERGSVWDTIEEKFIKRGPSSLSEQELSFKRAYIKQIIKDAADLERVSEAITASHGKTSDVLIAANRTATDGLTEGLTELTESIAGIPSDQMGGQIEGVVTGVLLRTTHDLNMAEKSVSQALKEGEINEKAAIAAAQRATRMLALFERAYERNNNPSLSRKTREKALTRTKGALSIDDDSITVANYDSKFPWQTRDFTRASEERFITADGSKYDPAKPTVYGFMGMEVVDKRWGMDKIRKRADSYYIPAFTNLISNGGNRGVSDIQIAMPIYDQIVSEEQMFTRFAINKDPTFAHPHLRSTAEAIFLDRISKEEDGKRVALPADEIVRNFVGLSFVGHSYGSSAIIQTLNHAHHMMVELHIDKETRDRAFNQVCAVLNAPAAMVYEHMEHLPIKKASVGSPLDELAQGDLRKQRMAEQSMYELWDLLSPDDVRQMLAGEYTKMRQPSVPYIYKDKDPKGDTVLFAKVVVGTVAFEEASLKLSRDAATQQGHRFTDYVVAINQTSPKIGVMLAERARMQGQQPKEWSLKEMLKPTKAERLDMERKFDKLSAGQGTSSGRGA